MKYFYLIEQNILMPNKFYKVYVKDNELWFAKIGGQFAGVDTLNSNSLIVDGFYALVKRYWIDPRVEKREAIFDSGKTLEAFLSYNHTFTLSLKDIKSATIHELYDTIEITLHKGEKVKYGIYIDDVMNWDELAAIFHASPVKRIDYFW